jgi:23S rRNA (uridine2552-2'-O)-methyltransferase
VGKRNNPYSRADSRTRAAKAGGYPARSVFKLKEVENKCHLFAEGQRVLDLGAAPGSWARFAARTVGPGGKVVAIDLKELTIDAAPNIVPLRGNAFHVHPEIREAAPYDIVMSDMAPNTSGSKLEDQSKSFRLFCGAVRMGARLGKLGSHFVGKLFMSDDFEEARELVRHHYEKCRVIRPKSVRTGSSELFLVGLNLKLQLDETEDAGAPPGEMETDGPSAGPSDG